MTYVISYKKGVCMIPTRYRLFKSILMVWILQFMIGCGGYSVDELTDAAGTGNVEKVKQILDVNPDLINQRDSQNETALIWAIDPVRFIINASRHIDVIKVLLERGADITITKANGHTPLMWSVSVHIPTLNLDQVLKDNSTIRIKMIEMLLEADRLLPKDQRTINVPDPDGDTPLDFVYDAIDFNSNGYRLIIKVLEDNGAKTSEVKENN